MSSTKLDSQLGGYKCEDKKKENSNSENELVVSGYDTSDLGLQSAKL